MSICKGCEERRIKMKRWIAQKTGQVWKDDPATQQASNASAEHQQQAVEADTPASPSAGRVSVPSVQEDRAGEGRGTRRSRGERRGDQ